MQVDLIAFAFLLGGHGVGAFLVFGVLRPAAGPPPRAFPLTFRERPRGLKNSHHATASGVRCAGARLLGPSVTFTPTSWSSSAAFIRRISHAARKSRLAHGS